MATPIIPSEPSTIESNSNPNSINSLMKITDEQKKQAVSDTKYDTKGQIYEKFQGSSGLPNGQKVLSIGLSFAIAAGVLLVIGGLLPKTKKR
jgi:hypothetical protein